MPEKTLLKTFCNMCIISNLQYILITVTRKFF